MLDINKFDQKTREYYEGHIQRFQYQDELFRNLPDMKLVYDLGTWFPFSSYVFAEKGAKVLYGCEAVGNHSGTNNAVQENGYVISNTERILCDFDNPPALEQADMVICCECLEHLSCNLYPVRDYLVSLVKPGGYLFLSMPTGNIKHGEWSDTFEKLENNPHRREFPGNMARKFCEGTGLDILSEVFIKTALYPIGEGICHILMRRKE